MAKKYVAEDSASMFVLEDVDDQFGLKTPSRRKPKHRRRVLPSLKATSTTNVEKKAKLRSTLRPHFVSSGDEQPPTLIIDKNLDEQDSEIAKIGLVTAEDAVDYFAADQEGKVVFVHLIPTVSSTDFRPYSLDVVPASVAVARGDYYTMSRSGLVHCVLEKGSNSTEFTPLHEWIRHCTFFNVLRSMNFFRYFLHFKLFREWRRNVRRKLYRDQRLKLQSKLFLSREVFRTPCMLLKAEISSISKFPLVSVQRSGRPQSDPLDVFLEQQNATRKGAAVACEAMMKSVVEILATACDAVQKLDREATLLDQDPRKRLEVLMNAKLLDDDGATSPSTRHKSMNSAVEEKKARKRLAIRAAEDRSMLSDFVRLADTMMVELVVDHVLQSFEHDLLADFLTNSSSDHHHQQHKTIGLFEVALGFDDTGLIFVPPLNEFCAKADGLADEVIALAGRIPRVLDARGCAEHCTSADSAAKFEPLIRSLPRYRLFVDSLRLKFAQDFDVARQHNLPTAETVRPIYEASRDFCQDEERARLLSNESSIDAAVRREFDQMMAWNKDLDKLRTRDSVGTIEVTSRQLKLTLSAFIEKKLDLLKSIIRERARDQCGEVLKTLKRRVSQLEDVPSTLQEYAEYVQRTADYDERDMRKLRNHVDQMYAILQSNDVKIRPEDLVALEEMHSYASQYSEQLAKSRALKENALDGHSEQLDKDIVALNSSLGQLTADLSSGPFLLPELYFSEDDDSISASLDNLQKQLAEYSDTVSTYSSYKELFGGGYGVVDTAPLKLATDQYNVMEKLWKCVRDWRRAHKEWTEGDLTRLDADDVDRQMQEFSAKAFSLNKTLDSPVSARLVSVVDEFKPLMPLVGDLGNPAMLQRHWEKLCTALGKSFADVELPISLSDFIEWGVNDQVDLVSEVSATATGESQLQKSLEKMEEAWKSMKFTTKEWRTDGSYILVGVDEIQQELDDQIVKTQAMRGSRFVHPFLKQATDWESMLHTLQEIIDNWLLVQSAWLYLEPIFSSDDISRQIPAEARMFKVVNQVWRESMAVTVQDPAVVSVARRDSLVEKLKDSNQKLDRINKGLSEYLETKRLAFPRFFFLSNEELLSILAETKNPLLVQPHLKKSFDGICNLEFTERNDIIAAYDGAVGKSERLEFTYEACQHKKINPRDSNGNVECWLVEVEAIMKKSLAHAIDLALLEFATTERNDWLRKWQGQTLLTVNQITWVHQVENAIVQGQLTELHARRSDELLDIVKVVRGDISKSLRKTLGSLVVMDVHNRDVTQQLSQSTIKSPNEFGWQAHLRYYVRPDLKKKRSALTGEPGSIDCRMINASILYAYEYIGNCGRLVITPLTDRY